jgi:hypothetical protein
VAEIIESPADLNSQFRVGDPGQRDLGAAEIGPRKERLISARSIAISGARQSRSSNLLTARARSAATLTTRSKSCSQIADGRNDIWPRPPGSPQARGTPVPPAMWGKSCAGMLILAVGDRGLPMDYDELERWTRVEFERGMRSRKGER